MRQAQILLYNLNNAKGSKIEKLCKRLAIAVSHIKKEQYHYTIGYLAGVLETDEMIKQMDDNSIEEEVFVMVDFPDQLLDQFLKEYRKTHIEPVSLKAILTSSNETWCFYELYRELSVERQAFQDKA